MNMKDAFRFQNKLQTLMGTAQDILSSSRNITKVENTYLRKKVMPEAEDEVTVDQPTSQSFRPVCPMKRTASPAS